MVGSVSSLRNILVERTLIIFKSLVTKTMSGKQPEVGAEALTKNKGFNKCNTCFKSPCACPKQSNGSSSSRVSRTTNETSNNSDKSSQ